MKQKKASILEKVSPNLLVPPHIIEMLFHLFTGEWQSNTVQQEQLVTHLTECSHCRTSLITLLAAAQKYEKSSSNTEAFIDDLFMQFVNLHHKIESQGYEQMGAYAEAVVAKGEKEANKQFPRFAEHIKSCPRCRTTLEEILDFLKESDEMR